MGCSSNACIALFTQSTLTVVQLTRPGEVEATGTAAGAGESPAPAAWAVRRARDPNTYSRTTLRDNAATTHAKRTLDGKWKRSRDPRPAPLTDSPRVKRAK